MRDRRIAAFDVGVGRRPAWRTAAGADTMVPQSISACTAAQVPTRTERIDADVLEREARRCRRRPSEQVEHLRAPRACPSARARRGTPVNEILVVVPLPPMHRNAARSPVSRNVARQGRRAATATCIFSPSGLMLFAGGIVMHASMMRQGAMGATTAAIPSFDEAPHDSTHAIYSHSPMLSPALNHGLLRRRNFLPRIAGRQGRSGRRTP